jgi:hypothetical protein
MYTKAYVKSRWNIDKKNIHSWKEESRIIIGFEALLGQNNKQNIFYPTLQER